MTLQTVIKPTSAETALMEAFGRQFGQLPGDAGVTTQRSTLLQTIKTEGLPTRRREAWHYTDLRTLLRSVPQETAVAVEAVAPLIEGSTQFVLTNGTAGKVASVDGISVKSYAASLLDGSALKSLSVRDKDDFIGRLNGSFVRDGFSIDIAEGHVAEAPIEILSLQGGGMHNSRMPVRFGKQSRATVIERHLAGSDATAMVSAISDITLGEGADVTWVILQQQGVEDSHFGQIRVKFAKDAKLRLYIINAGGGLVRQDVHVDVDGEGAHLMLRGINLLAGSSHTDVTLVLGHNVANTSSSEVIRNVIFDKAHGVFQGQIRVAPDAQKTDAKMSCNTLLLSDEAEFSTKPELEIFADDVVCGHGATVTDIDHNHLFYLASRGIPEAQARGLLVKAFVQETIEELEDEVLIEALETVVSDWLDLHV